MSPLMMGLYVLIPFVVIITVPWIMYIVLGLFL